MKAFNIVLLVSCILIGLGLCFYGVFAKELFFVAVGMITLFSSFKVFCDKMDDFSFH